MGGQTGITQDLFLDWLVDDEERISICAGEIESTNETSEVKIVIDPLTQEYRVEGQLDRKDGDSLCSGNQTFFLWDSKSCELNEVTTGGWTRLKSSQAIIATTASDLAGLKCWGNLEDEAGIQNPNDLAQLLRSSLAGGEPLVVLKRV
jgi:hypothetical protein